MKIIKASSKESFMTIDTNLKSSQHMEVVIIKKGEIVEPCFDLTT